MGKKGQSISPLSDREEAEIQRMIAADPDNPEITDKQIAQAKPFGEVFPHLSDLIRRGRGRPTVERPRKQVSLRLDPDVLEKFKATGKGWQGRINDVLKQAKL
jgi:uncharacterized protein (DUF4415 family)